MLANTRDKILEAAYSEIYTRGFQSASLSSILMIAGVTKGALYHHFPSKLELGYAVVDEVIRAHMQEVWIEPVTNAENPIDGIRAALALAAERVTPECVRLGCPLNNLVQEMAPLDEGFRERLKEIFAVWRDAYSKALQEGQSKGYVRADINPQQTALFVIAGVEGCVGVSKNWASREALDECGDALVVYLESLRPQH